MNKIIAILTIFTLVNLTGCTTTSTEVSTDKIARDEILKLTKDDPTLKMTASRYTYLDLRGFTIDRCTVSLYDPEGILVMIRSVGDCDFVDKLER
jgi:hypothetical protein